MLSVPCGCECSVGVLGAYWLLRSDPQMHMHGLDVFVRHGLTSNVSNDSMRDILVQNHCLRFAARALQRGFDDAELLHAI